MHAVKLLHNLIKKSCVGIHSKRLNALFTVVMGLVTRGKLSVAGMGRSLNTQAKVKNKIKLVDRLVGNKKLHAERKTIYDAMARFVISTTQNPIIIVDWSSLPNINYYLLRAAVPAQGRSLTIYEEVHPAKKLGNHKVHKEFLTSISKMLPGECKPIIVTDAGFHSPFFRLVEKLSWDWVGRIRGLAKYRLLESENWVACKKLYEIATNIPKFICEAILSKSTPIKCYLFLFKGKKKGRVAKNKSGKRRKDVVSKACAKANKEPWLLATSLKNKKKTPKKVIKIYQKRFQIEEGFRDIKNSRLGFSFEESLTYKQERFEILLLIAMLGVLAVTLLGKATTQRGLQYEFQANTIRNRIVLSLFFLGCQVIREQHIKFSNQELLMALKALISSVNEWEDINA
jgi:hypothetical protein